MKKKILALLLVASMTFGLAACGGTTAEPPKTDPVAETPAETPATTPAETPATPATDSATAKSPDSDMVVALNTDIQKLDPHDTSDTLSMTVGRTMYEALLTFDDNQTIQPALAESYEVSEDNLTYTLKLRTGVKFHDGTDFNAAAVKANYDRCMADEALRQNRTVKKWASLEATDESTVVIKLLEPNNTFTNKLTMFNIISPKSIEAGTDTIRKSPCGTGAYVFKERVEGSHVTVTPFADYWNGAPTLSSLNFRAVPEDGSRVAMLQTGEADFIYPMPAIQAATVNGNNDIEVIANPSCIMRYVTLNTTLPELSDVKVRQAMNYAINKEAYIKTVFNGFASTVASCYPSTVQYYSAQPEYSFDLEKAKTLMKEAGYEKGFKLTLWGDNTTNEQKGMQFVQQQLAQIGIEVEVLPMEPNTLGDMIYVPKEEAKINMWYVNWSPSSFDADGAIRNILYSEMTPPTSANTAYYNNPEFDKKLQEALLITDAAQLTQIYADVQKMVWEDSPWLFLGSDQVVAGRKTYANGIYLGPDGCMNFSKASLS